VRTGSRGDPDGYVGLVHPRSGLPARLGVTVLNAPGTVDSGYRGEILVKPDQPRPGGHCEDLAWRSHRQALVQRAERAVFTAWTSCPTRCAVRAGTAPPAGTSG
jgi:dUTP pyrophosphatase